MEIDVNSAKSRNIISTKLIDAGVRNLKEFGYPNCTKDNILTDMVYSKFFTSMLLENKGHSEEYDSEIDSLILEIEGN